MHREYLTYVISLEPHPTATGRPNEYSVPSSLELEKRERKKRKTNLEIHELLSPNSKGRRWFMEVILPASLTGVSISMCWLSVASWCEMIVSQLVVKHMCLCVNINMYINTVGGGRGCSQPGGWIGGKNQNCPLVSGRQERHLTCSNCPMCAVHVTMFTSILCEVHINLPHSTDAEAWTQTGSLERSSFRRWESIVTPQNP